MPTAWARRAADRARRIPFELVAADDPVLLGTAVDVESFGREELDVLIHRLYLTCRTHNGAAIAAPQVGVPLRLIVVHDAAHDRGVVFCNPRIHPGGPLVTGPESCLSLPGRTFAVPRHRHAVVVGQDANGEPFGADVVGFEARMWQHELDHLEGRLLTGRFPEIGKRLVPEPETGSSDNIP